MTQPAFLVLGAGSWGSALALYLHRHQQLVQVWTHESAQVDAIKAKGENAEFMPGIPWPETLPITASLAEAFDAVVDPHILVVVPSHAFETVLQQMKPFLTPHSRIIWATKGLSPKGEFLHQVCEATVGARPMAALSGPNFAGEVARQLPTAVTIAANDPEFSKALLEAFHSPQFRVYLSDDIVGVELGGVVKNVIAIGVGIADGLGLGANTRAALVTRGLKEFMRLGSALGAHTPTMMGMSGVGDLVLTCTDDQSRNRRFGLALAQGESIAAAKAAIGQVVEGARNVTPLLALAQQHQVEMPICQVVAAVLAGNMTPKQAVASLANRAPKFEV